MGSNGGWENDYQQLILQYDDIILNSNCKYYIIVGDTDDPGTSLADDNQGEYNEDGSYEPSSLYSPLVILHGKLH